eukprot:Hpha_TRINITY_DN19186_c0_g1::TRINITY_DN19186_c0_g1_i1::g.94671::m.94671
MVNEAKLAWFGDKAGSDSDSSREFCPLEIGLSELEQLAQTFGVIMAPEADDLTALRFLYYQDQPGPLLADVRNPDDLPKMQLEVDVYGKRITYGPFVDQIRGRLQQAFMPWDYRTWPVFTKTTDDRPYGALEIGVRFCSPTTTIVLPWRQKAPTPNPPMGIHDSGTPPQRLEISCGEGSRLACKVPYVQMTVQEAPMMEVMFEMKECNWWTTVNSADWITAEVMRIHVDVTYASEYVHNLRQTWDVGFVVSGGDMWYSTEHLNFLFDMAADWSYAYVTYLGEHFNRGDTASLDYFAKRYIPYVTCFEFFFTDCFDVHFIVNDNNVIPPGTHNSFADNAVLTMRTHGGVVEYVSPADVFICAQENEFAYTVNVDLKDCEFHMSLPESHEADAAAQSSPPVFCTIERFRVRGNLSSVWPNALRAQGQHSWRPHRDHRMFREAYPRGGGAEYWGDLRSAMRQEAKHHTMKDNHAYHFEFDKLTGVLHGWHLKHLANWWGCYMGEDCCFVDPQSFLSFKGWTTGGSLEGRNLRYLYEQFMAAQEFKWKLRDMVVELTVRACQLYFPVAPGCVTVFQAPARVASSTSPSVPMMRGRRHSPDEVHVAIPNDEEVHVIGQRGDWAKVRREFIGWVKRRRLEQVLDLKAKAEAAMSDMETAWQGELRILSDYGGQPLSTAQELHEAFRRFRDDEMRRGVPVAQAQPPFDAMVSGKAPLIVLAGDEVTKLLEDGAAGGEFALLRWRSVGWVGVHSLRIPNSPSIGSHHRPPLRYGARPPGFWRVESAERRSAMSGFLGSRDFVEVSFYELAFTNAGTNSSSDMSVTVTPITIRPQASESSSSGSSGLAAAQAESEMCMTVDGVEWSGVTLYQPQEPGESSPFYLMFHARSRLNVGAVTGHLLAKQLVLIERVAVSMMELMACRQPSLLETEPPSIAELRSSFAHIATTSAAGAAARAANAPKAPLVVQPALDQGSSWWKAAGRDAQAFHLWVEGGERDVRDATEQAYSFTTMDVDCFVLNVGIGCANLTDPVEYDGFCVLEARRGGSYARTTLNDGDAGPGSSSTRNTTQRATVLVPQLKVRLLREKGVTAGAHGDHLEVGGLTTGVRLHFSEAKRSAGRDPHEHYHMQRRILTEGFAASVGKSAAEMEQTAPEPLKHAWPSNTAELSARWRGMEKDRMTSLAGSIASVVGQPFGDCEGLSRRLQSVHRPSHAGWSLPNAGGRRKSAPPGGSLDLFSKQISPLTDGFDVSPSTGGQNNSTDDIRVAVPMSATVPSLPPFGAGAKTPGEESQKGRGYHLDPLRLPTPRTPSGSEGETMRSCNEPDPDRFSRGGSFRASPALGASAGMLQTCQDWTDDEADGDARPRIEVPHFTPPPQPPPPPPPAPSGDAPAEKERCPAGQQPPQHR